MTAPADAPFTLAFDNQDAGIPHDVEIKDAAGASRLQDATSFPGVAKRDYTVAGAGGRRATRSSARSTRT